MEFRVLGPLEVRANTGALALGSRKQQVVLALLAVNANRVVSADALVDEVWPERPPASAVANVRGYAANLRRIFDSETGDGRIVRSSAGYVLHVQSDELDLLVYREHTKRAGDAHRAGDLAAASAQYAAALACWQGSMISGLPRGPLLRAGCTAVEEERLVIADHLAELLLQRDEPAEAQTLLRLQLATNPLRERTYVLLMRALCHVGDVAGALTVFSDARRALVEQLGVDPGPELQAACQVILAGGSPAATGRNGSVTVGLTPRELPPETGHFVGRAAEVAEIRAALTQRENRCHRRTFLALVYGPGGAGKSALVVHVAHQVASAFPDGQLYVDLFGSTPGLRSLSTADVLGRLLRSLGVPDADVPRNESDAVARLRTLTANRRLLLVLDNAEDAQQIAPVLPANGQCAVIVSARSQLSALDADCRLRLGGLPSNEAVALLIALSKEVTFTDDVAKGIVALCDHLPLAVRIAAGRVVGRPDLAPLELAERLEDRRRRLDELEVDGLAVRSCIRVGYEALASSTQPANRLAARALRALGLLNVPDARVEVVAALLGLPDDRRVLTAVDLLVGAGLLEPMPGGRYRLHDLVRLVAAEEAAATDDEETRTDALGRGLAYYAVGAHRADVLLRPSRFNVFESPPEISGLPYPVFAGRAEARMWVEAELPSLVAAVEQASGVHGFARRMTLWIFNIAWEYLHIRYEWQTLERLGRLVLRNAERFGDAELAGWAHIVLGRCSADQGDFAAAESRFERAVEVFRELGNNRGVGLAQNALGVLAEYRGDLLGAVPHFDECLRSLGQEGGAGHHAVVWGNLGSVYGTLGRSEDAISALKRSLAIRRSYQDALGMASTLANLTIVYGVRGMLEEAQRCAEESLSRCREAGTKVHEHAVLLARSEVRLRSRRLTDALSDAEAVLTAARAGAGSYIEALAQHQRFKILAAMGAPVSDGDRTRLSMADVERLLVRRNRHLERLLLG